MSTKQLENVFTSKNKNSTNENNNTKKTFSSVRGKKQLRKEKLLMMDLLFIKEGSVILTKPQH